MTAGIAHEIKNPLNFVINYSESSLDLIQELREEMKEGDRLEGRSEVIEDLINDLEQNSLEIKENGERANRIVFSLMDQTRSSEGQRKMVQLNELVKSNLKLAFHGYRANNPSFNMEIVFDLDGEIGQVQVDPQSLGRVLINLFNNAFDAMYEKSKVAPADYQATINVSTRDQQDHIEVNIRDNGEGIREDVSKQIFEPFFTTKPSGQGNTGLGLSISLDIIEQDHDGTMHVDSKPGQYTEFKIEIPYKRSRKPSVSTLVVD